MAASGAAALGYEITWTQQAAVWLGVQQLVGAFGQLVSLARFGADRQQADPRFGDPEALTELQLRLLEKKDRATLELIKNGDATAFMGSVLEAGDPRRICGLAPIFALLAAMGNTRGKLLRYEQAQDDTGTVSYASVGLWKA